MITWKRVVDYYVESECERYTIVPLYWGSDETPQAYEVLYQPSEAVKPIKVANNCKTQKEAKTKTDVHAQKIATKRKVSS